MIVLSVSLSDMHLRSANMVEWISVLLGWRTSGGPEELYIRWEYRFFPQIRCDLHQFTLTVCWLIDVAAFVVIVHVLFIIWHVICRICCHLCNPVVVVCTFLGRIQGGPGPYIFGKVSLIFFTLYTMSYEISLKLNLDFIVAEIRGVFGSVWGVCVCVWIDIVATTVFCSAKAQFWMISEAILIPKISCWLQHTRGGPTLQWRGASVWTHLHCKSGWADQVPVWDGHFWGLKEHYWKGGVPIPLWQSCICAYYTVQKYTCYDSFAFAR